MSLSSEDRTERIAKDDGSPDTPVWTVRQPGTIAYHDDRDCHALDYATSPIRETTRAKAQDALGKVPCRYCVLDDPPTNESGGAEYPETRFADLIDHDRKQRPARPSTDTD